MSVKLRRFTVVSFKIPEVMRRRAKKGEDGGVNELYEDGTMLGCIRLEIRVRNTDF